MQRRRAANLARRDAQTPLCPIVSVGNLTTGGTGKTPAVQWLCQALQSQGRSVGIASRGYGGSFSEKSALVSDGKTIFLSPFQAGDEAVLHARNLSGAIVAIAKNRHRAVQMCVENGAEIVVLDDGFQFWSLERAFDLILMDAKNPFGNGHLLPRGRLREEPAALGRASAILLTRCERASPQEMERARLQIGQQSCAPIFCSNHAPRDLRDEKSGEIVPLDWLQGRTIKAFAGLADNSQFYNALTKLGAQKIGHLARERGDHHAWKSRDFRWLDSEKNPKNSVHAAAIPVVTTEKDAVKLDPFWFDGPLFSLRIELRIENEAELLNCISSKLTPK
ncbi:lipid-A-disaccharide kinase [Abditibacterium utsteinense]|uniref:Tetraacyldisaccharide 4'-kinase n=2 Tax=Abditibacterium utsteinense TaxID=1960156 RepID=A0A2S8SX69_9BACT|nr:lipid-A-disaccharide kinase [Abditibacterium utsteinense]